MSTSRKFQSLRASASFWGFSANLRWNGCPTELLCTEGEILQLLQNLDVSKSNGPDGISAKCWRVHHAASPPLLKNCSISQFNQALSLAVGNHPQGWWKNPCQATIDQYHCYLLFPKSLSVTFTARSCYIYKVHIHGYGRLAWITCAGRHPVCPLACRLWLCIIAVLSTLA